MSESEIDLYEAYKKVEPTILIDKQNLLEYFNSQTLSNQILYENNTSTSSSSAIKLTLTGWTDFYLDYTPQGSIGLTNTSLTKKNSGHSYNRMYYTDSIEPDYQIVASFNSVFYHNFFKIKYNSEKIIGILRSNITNNMEYDIYFEFIKDGSNISFGNCLIEIVNISNYLSFYNTNYVLKYGLKDYNRAVELWNPYEFTNTVNEKIELYDEIDITEEFSIIQAGYTTEYKSNYYQFSVEDESLYNIDKSNLYRIYRYPGAYYGDIVQINYGKGYTSKYYNLGNDNEIRDESSFYYQFFVEGSEETLSIKINNNNNNNIYNVIESPNNEYVKMDKLSNLSYTITSGNYTKTFKPAKTPLMIKGYINGVINVKNCNDFSPEFEIRCFRNDDNLLIGSYIVTNNTYEIPNLDVNTYYDIILVDKTRNIEQNVSSYRRPIPYETRSLNSVILTGYKKDHTSHRLTWKIDGDKFDYINVYKSSEAFDMENLPEIFDKISYSRFYDYYHSLEIGTFNYMIEVITYKTSLFSNVITLVNE